jgi:predicted nucleotidyltransferase
VHPKQIAAIARRYGIRLVVQFGSSVTGRTHAQSDVDIGAFSSNIRPDSRTAILNQTCRHSSPAARSISN